MNNVIPSPQHRVLIANRGEIAVRIIRACQDYGADSIAVYADPDADALFVRMANEAWALSGVTPAETYLHIDKIIDIARRAGATMLHPGYGFLSERADFARAVQAAGLIWIGPSAETIEQLGDKVSARKIALACGAPLVKGSADPVSNAAEVREFAQTHGLPVAIKAAFGGGGHGLKVAWQFDEIEERYYSAVREAKAAFGRGECYVEQYLDRPRHIEAQILADKQGNVVVIGTRDCSLQRRHQKLIEEAPAPFVNKTQRETIHKAARDICASAGYTGAGTVEFLLSRDGTLSFLEVNPRLQVEHPVTEETTGIDLVIEQIRIAEGLPLNISKTPEPIGHAIEFRINAEDPGRGFLPAPGIISHFHAPTGPGIRLDSGVETGHTIPGSYDSMMAKLIVSGATRKQVIQRARRALKEFAIDGVASVLPFHRAILEHPAFTIDFQVHTRWIETEFDRQPAPLPRQLPASDLPLTRTWIELDGRRVSLALPATLLNQATPITSVLPQQQQPAGYISAPVCGVLHSWLAQTGHNVQQGNVIAIMEAMKMEIPIIAPVSGTLKQHASPGSYQESGQLLGEIEQIP